MGSTVSADVQRKGMSHHNGWPNAQGFDTSYQELDPVELEVSGYIPSYVAGTLYRTGAGTRIVDTGEGAGFRVHHWFDNLSINHRFQILPTSDGSSCRVLYNSRSTCDGLIEKIEKTGDRDGLTFGAKYDPCKTFFQKVQSIFQPSPAQSPSTFKPNAVSVAVTMSCNFPGLSRTGEANHNSGVRSLCNKTDANILQMLDPTTLEPIGLATQKILNPELKGVLSSAHAQFDPITGDAYNYNLDFVNGKGLYRIFTTSASTGATSILASIKAKTAYIHSMFLTEHYFVLAIWNSHFGYGGISLLTKRNFVDAINAFDPSIPAQWYIIDRTPIEQGGRGLVATFESEPFYCFHAINAYEETCTSENTTAQTHIIADLAAYENLDILKRFYLENLMSDSPDAKSFSDPSNAACRPSTWRFRLSDIPSPDIKQSNDGSIRKAEVIFKVPKLDSLELPTINPLYSTKPHRYVYGTSDTGRSTFMDGLTKFDSETLSTRKWSVFGHSAGEPIFVPKPTRADGSEQEEDEGVLLSVVLDGFEGKSYLLVLDAKHLVEVGRASLKGAIGFGFHGTHFPNSK